MGNEKKLHTFAICAYKDSPFLSDCIESLMFQRKYSDIIMCTSTPDDYIKNMAEKYDIPLYIRDGKSDIVDDWNFAVSKAKTKWVTVAHQDDVYNRSYSIELTKAIKKRPNAIMAFTDYYPIKKGQISTDLNSRLRRFFRFPMKSRLLSSIKFFKKYSLAFGNSICCPTCAYNKELCRETIFQSRLKFACDWETFVDLAGTRHPFIYVDKVLTYYRIHDEATSKEWTEDDKRKTEEIYMFRKFWPMWLVKIGYNIFKISYKTYD